MIKLFVKIDEIVRQADGIFCCVFFNVFLPVLWPLYFLD